jgi:hypothetical protein
MRLEKKFFKEFNIPPYAKKGETIFNNSCRWALIFADKDYYPTINAERILELEELLLNWDKETEVAVSKYKGKYSYDGMSNDKSGDSYHHYFNTKYFKTRKEALLDLLIQYVHVEYIYKGVREIFIKCST